MKRNFPAVLSNGLGGVRLIGTPENSSCMSCLFARSESVGARIPVGDCRGQGIAGMKLNVSALWVCMGSI